ncbi:hypothetical protein CEXT_600291 [Caerostris extrusa]|uniref:Uncharacterized protein n=1 Tax=Caerostris extrusa TaxID=172846 RepID=A0AAV4Y4K0_CAEEX|nr:hypothetical protein CEXT_600291 [Caerostris extrusa]
MERSEARGTKGQRASQLPSGHLVLVEIIFNNIVITHNHIGSQCEFPCGPFVQHSSNFPTPMATLFTRFVPIEFIIKDRPMIAELSLSRYNLPDPLTSHESSTAARRREREGGNVTFRACLARAMTSQKPVLSQIRQPNQQAIHLWDVTIA